MSDIAVSLTPAQATKMLPVLQKVSKEVSADQRKILTTWIGQIEKNITRQKVEKAREAAEAQTARAITDLRQIVLAVIPKLKSRGFTAETVGYINLVDKIFQKANKDFDAAQKAAASSKPRAQRHAVSVPAAEFDKIINSTARKLTKATDNFLASNLTPLLTSQKYPYAIKRRRLANSTFATALARGRSAAQWDELDMLSMSFSDMNSHVQLGLALLDGAPAKIDAASNMDTSCREELSTSVWNFVQDVLSDDIKDYRRPTDRRRFRA